ncbi:phage tail tube protein [Methylorubrum populi]
MTIASGSTRRIAFVPEATFGVAPATPSFKTFRATGGGPRTNKTTDTSDEIRADRNVTDEMHLGQDVAGAYNTEWSYGGFTDDMLEAVLFGSWAANVLKNGTTPKSFTFEERVDLGGGNQSFSRFAGTMINGLSLAIAARSKVTGSVSVMAQKETLDTAIVTGATYAAASTTPISTASANIAALQVAGLPAPKVRSLSLDLTNNLRTRPLVGSLYTDSFGYGRFEVTGTLEAYFETNDLYQRVLDHGSGVLSFNIGNAANQKYAFLLPKIIFGNGERRPGGNNDDVMVSIPFRAVYDQATDATLQITRGVA